MSKVTIYDVAREAKCSTATVSLVLKNSNKIKPETREHIFNVIAKLGYTPNYSAQCLSVKKTNTVGLIVPNIENPLFSQMIAGIEEYANMRGYDLLLGISESTNEKEDFYLDMLLRKRVDGLLLFPTFLDRLSDKLSRFNRPGTPIVLCGSSGNGIDNISFVKCDNRTGSFKAIEHLIERGCSKIGCIFPVISKHQYKSRLTGYKDALYYNGIPFREELIRTCPTDSPSIFAATAALLKEEKPDGIFCLYDYATISVMRAVLNMGLKIPDDVALIGYDNIQISEFLPISLSTVDTHGYEVGKKAAEILLNQIDDPDSAIRQITIKPDIIIRESSSK